MSHIYRPSGRAAEYSPFALNLYTGCPHDCEYCWARNLGKRRDKHYVHTSFHLQNISPESVRRDFMKHAGLQEQVLMCFTTDPYVNGGDTSMTSFALAQALEFEVPIAILTKAPSNAVRDFDLMTQFGDSLIMGTTITTMQNYEVTEPFADHPFHRIGAAWKAKNHGIRTWLSMEPAYSISEALEIIEQTQSVFDHYKLGRMNYRKLPVDWTQYVVETAQCLRSLGKSFYVKDDLAVFSPMGFLTADERNPRLYDARPFRSTESERDSAAQ